MIQPANWRERLLARADAGVLILTSTRRLRRSLLLELSKWRAGRGVTVAPAADIFTLDEWLRRCWESLLPDEDLLRPSGQKLIWEDIIRADQGETSLDAGAVADLAIDAWGLTRTWGEPDYAPGGLSAECSAYRRWQTEFCRRLDKASVLTPVQLIAPVAAGYRDGALAARRPPAVILAGFEQLSPAVERLLRLFETAGTSVELLEPEGEPAAATLTAYDDIRHEVRAVAALIRSRVEALSAERRAALRIGVIIADVGRYKDLVERIFNEEFDPARCAVGEGERPRLFEVAIAPKLSDYGFVAHALDLLALEIGGNPFRLVSRILLAPFPRPHKGEQSGVAESSARAVCEVALRSANRASVDLRGDAGVESLLAKSGAHAYAAALAQLIRRLEACAREAGPATWAAHFAACLGDMGWSSGSIEGVEGVVFAKWREALAELGALGSLQARMSRAEAFGCLVELCEQTEVQMPTLAPQVQVLDFRESSGLCFDAVYCLGMTASALPRPPRPNPLLPALWQAQAATPRASVDVEMAFTRRMWGRILRSTEELHASYPRMGEGGEELRPTPLLPASARALVDQASDPPFYLPDPETMAAAVEDRPPDPPLPARMRRGGTKLLRDQSLCPFMTLAATRLAADVLEAPSAEPGPLTRGELVHSALEAFYRGHSRGIGAGDPDDEVVAAAVEAAVQTALAGSAGRRVSPQQKPAASLWLEEQVCAWLDYERGSRPAGWEVVDLEQEISLAVGSGDGGPDIEVRGKIDRIDRLGGGGLFIIDYKTGSAGGSPRLWSGERPRDVQLPIYAASLRAAGERVDGMAFAGLGARDSVSLRGLAAETVGGKVKVVGDAEADDFADELGQGAEQPWTRIMEALAGRLGTLAKEFAAGGAAVRPLDGKVCRNCRRQPLCRVFEAQPGQTEATGTES